MILPGVQTEAPAHKNTPSQAAIHKHRTPWPHILLCLLLACTGASWFSYQSILVPQPAHFVPNWQGAQWIRAADGNNPFTYFHYSTTLNVLPDGAFVMIAANQLFSLYVNGSLMGSNAIDIVQRNGPRAYMYDIASALQIGQNSIAVAVSNIDQQTPSLRLSFGMVQSGHIIYRGTDNGWQATAQSSLAYPRYATVNSYWIANNFDTSSWPPAQPLAADPLQPLLTVNPLLYEQPLPVHWMSAGAGHEGYFVRKLSLPADETGTWLRVVATGPASIFINGKLFIAWNGQAPVPVQQHDIADFLSDQETVAQYKNNLLSGIYDISPHIHSGVNTIAVHVTAPGSSAAQLGLEAFSAALSLDILTTDAHGNNTWFTTDTGWHASPQPIQHWNQADALAWSPPLMVGRPGMSHAIYLPDSTTPRNVNILPFTLVAIIVLWCTGAIIGLWLLMALLVMRRYYASRTESLAMLSLAYIPALACEVLLIVLARESMLPQPFPYTWQWGLVLLALVAIGYLLLWLQASGKYKSVPDLTPTRGVTTCCRWLAGGNVVTPLVGVRLGFPNKFLAWLRTHWALVLLIAIAIPLICYNLSYEPYWQDELTSYNAAKGILAHGIPLMPSGFLYPKGELYSYVLALSMLIFGEQNGALRLPSVAAYLLSLPLFYAVACYFFERRIALLATAMLAFSPFVLIWGRSVRMYEQAQLLVILVMYLFYKALPQQEGLLRKPEPDSHKGGHYISPAKSPTKCSTPPCRGQGRPHLVYLAIASLIAAYLSHEEIFIILPALVVCVLVASRDTKRLLPSVLYQKHWWIAAVIGASIIGLQLLIARVSHPPVLGTDQSQQPLVQFTTDNIAYYFKLMFNQTALNYAEPVITINSFLALAGCMWAFYRGDARAKYCALFLLISFLTLILMFTATADRYIYTLLPVFYLIGAYALLTALRAIWRLAHIPIGWQSRVPGEDNMPHPPQHAFPQPLRLMALFTTLLVCASIVLVPTMPISGYNLFLSRILDSPYHRHYPDYDAAAQYVHQHWQKGDIVVCVSPAISIRYYVGQVDYFFSLDRALYLFEKNNGITDTPTGTVPLLSQADFQSVLSTHARIWLLTDGGTYLSALLKNQRFTFPPDFHIVYRGYGSTVYLRGS